MSVRISTSQFYNTTQSNYQKNFANAAKSQQDASDNIRVRSAKDDPVAPRVCCSLSSNRTCSPSTTATPPTCAMPWAPPKAP